MSGYRTRLWVGGTAAALLFSSAASSVGAVSLTDATRELLKVTNLGPDVLEGLDKELTIPQAWIEGARKEDAVRIRLTMHETNFAKVWKVFSARYPDIKMEYTRGIGQQRAVGPLLALKRGSYVADIVTSFETMEKEFREIDGLLDLLKELPAAKSIRPDFNSAHGIGVAWRLQHYCIAYATDRVKKANLPKTWEELLTDTRWRNGKVGMAANFNVWLAQLWGLKGEAWTTSYMDRIFSDLKPQLRKERLAAIPKLTTVGEFDLAIPGGDAIVMDFKKEGVPVGFHCPDPVPIYMAWVGVVKGGPRVNSAKVFANWLLSREGQIAVWHADNVVPASKELMRKEFFAFPEEVLGKKVAAYSPVVIELMPKIATAWQQRWVHAGGPEN